MISVTIPLAPKGKGSVRTAANGIAYMPKATRQWMRDASRHIQAASDGRHLEGPLGMEIQAVFRRPKALSRAKDFDGYLRHHKRPDADNIAKMVLDACTKAGLWVDDSQVCSLTVQKFYGRASEEPWVGVHVWELGPRASAQEVAP